MGVLGLGGFVMVKSTLIDVGPVSSRVPLPGQPTAVSVSLTRVSRKLAGSSSSGCPSSCSFDGSLAAACAFVSWSVSGASRGDHEHCE